MSPTPSPTGVTHWLSKQPASLSCLEMLETHLTGPNLKGVYCSLPGKLKEARRAPAMSVAPLATYLPPPGSLPTAQAAFLAHPQLQEQELVLSFPQSQPLLTQTSDWLGLSHLLTSKPITVAGGLPNPEGWL